jgi:hypothetical protein
MNPSIPFRWMGVFIYSKPLWGCVGKVLGHRSPPRQTSPVSSPMAATISTMGSPVSQEQATSQTCQSAQQKTQNLFQPNKITSN